MIATFVAVGLLSMGAWGAGAEAAESPQTARAALKTLTQQRGADYLGRVVMVEGRYGSHQPQAWRILAFDPKQQGRLREFMVSGGRIASERLLIAWKNGQRVPLREVSVDSKDAFLRADLAAKDAKIGFDTLDYQLLMPAGSSEPLWLVTLVGKDGDAVGEVQVGAKSGVVWRKAWQRSAPPAAAPQQREGEGTEDAVAGQAVAQGRAPRQAVPAPVPPARGGAGAADTAASAAVAGKLTGDAAAIRDASGRILEGARQGILRTSGNVRSLFKQALQGRRSD